MSLNFMRITSDFATCMYYTGVDSFKGKDVDIAHHLRDRKLKLALPQFFKPENYFEVRHAPNDVGGGVRGHACFLVFARFFYLSRLSLVHVKMTLYRI
jgi:hypothetical protein